MFEQFKERWRGEFDRLIAGRSGLAPVLLFLPNWWPGRHAAFAYFHVVAIGPGLLSAPDPVRNYVLGHELGHIDRHHTAGQLIYWLAVLAAYLIGRRLPPGAQLGPVGLVLLVALAWIFLGETRREFEADDAAADRYGDHTVIQGLTWMQSLRKAPAPKLNALRLQRRRDHARA